LSVYEVLEAAGLAVVVVNGAHVKNLPGHQSDMADAPWISTLHMHGLRRGGVGAAGADPAAAGLSTAAVRPDHDGRGACAAHVLSAEFSS
jgi:hypothetical protein